MAGFESSTEVRLTGEAAGDGNDRKRQPCGDKQHSCFFEPSTGDKLRRSYARKNFKCPAKMKDTQAGNSRELTGRYTAVDVLIDMLSDTI